MAKLSHNTGGFFLRRNNSGEFFIRLQINHRSLCAAGAATAAAAAAV